MIKQAWCLIRKKSMHLAESMSNEYISVEFFGVVVSFFCGFYFFKLSKKMLGVIKKV